MATSTKVQFKLETLRQKALDSIDYRTGLKEEELEKLLDSNDLASRLRTWRAEQRVKLVDLVDQFDEMADDEMARFQFDSLPQADLHAINRAERELRSLFALRTQIVAKSESLVGDEDGNISLTKTQLSEFFGL